MAISVVDVNQSCRRTLAALLYYVAVRDDHPNRSTVSVVTMFVVIAHAWNYFLLIHTPHPLPWPIAHLPRYEQSAAVA